MNLNRVLQSRWRKYGLIFGFWALVAVVEAAQNYASQFVMENHAFPWGLAFRRAFEEWYPWAFLTVGILWVARRLDLERASAKRWFFLHLAGSALLSLVYFAIYAGLLSGQKSVIDGTTFEFGRVFRKLIIYYCHVTVIIYWMIVLAHLGWHYYRRNRERESQASALATELVRARLEVLRMQLNPHFLFNTLHVISALIHENPEDADRIVARLSELLRVSLEQSDTQEVPLRQELSFLERYLEIEQVRFQDRLAVELDIESGLDDILVPSLILQPLVENAIRHGIAPREDMGRLKIAARRLNGMLELKVGDNGPGLPEIEVASHPEGVGLSNTRSRLSHLYGANHQFQLTPAPGGGLEVTLLIPCRTETHASAPKVVVVSHAGANRPAEGMHNNSGGQRAP
ncbi:MAG: histidine kinase [Verrucomicrobia bacterium]|nr:MAG: histidine kinase [Verrucomicrobiota bacterium]